MRNLVYANEFGTSLASYLGCTLCNNSSDGDGFVTKVTEVQDVWDNLICINTVAPETSATVYGYTPLTYRMNNDRDFAEVVLQGAGVNLCPEQDLGTGLSLMLWLVRGEVVGDCLTVLEQQGLMNRDLGAATPVPSGVVVSRIEDHQDLYNQTMSGLKSSLESYSGPISLDLCVTDSNTYVQDVLFGFKPGHFEVAKELLQGNLLSEGLRASKNVSVGVLVSVAPWPLGRLESQIPLEVPESALPHLAPLECSNQTGILSTGLIGYVTAWGSGSDLESKLRAAKLRCYRTLRNVVAVGLQYRTDVGSRSLASLQSLLAHNPQGSQELVRQTS